MCMAEDDLRAALVARGAVIGEDRGIALPMGFGEPASEYRALRGDVGLLSLAHRALVVARGEDRATFLQGMLTNEVARLAPGSGCGALLLTIQGRVTADVRVAVCADAILLDVDARVRAPFVDALGKLLVADDVDFTESGDALLGVEGPRAGALLGIAAEPPPYAHVDVTVAGIDVRAVRASEIDGPGYVLHVPVAAAGRVWTALASAGAQPCGYEALEARRIEVGVPRVGCDMGPDVLALEVPVERWVSQSKGCYLGQEVVARGTARGHVNRRLCGVVLDGTLPARGSPLLSDGREAGVLTSVGYAFGLGTTAALAMVRREFWTPGTELACQGAPGGGRVAAFPLA